MEYYENTNDDGDIDGVSDVLENETTSYKQLRVSHLKNKQKS